MKCEILRSLRISYRSLLYSINVLYDYELLDIAGGWPHKHIYQKGFFQGGGGKYSPSLGNFFESEYLKI